MVTLTYEDMSDHETETETEVGIDADNNTPAILLEPSPTLHSESRPISSTEPGPASGEPAQPMLYAVEASELQSIKDFEIGVLDRVTTLVAWNKDLMDRVQTLEEQIKLVNRSSVNTNDEKGQRPKGEQDVIQELTDKLDELRTHIDTTVEKISAKADAKYNTPTTPELADIYSLIGRKLNGFEPLHAELATMLNNSRATEEFVKNLTTTIKNSKAQVSPTRKGKSSKSSKSDSPQEVVSKVVSCFFDNYLPQVVPHPGRTILETLTMLGRNAKSQLEEDVREEERKSSDDTKFEVPRGWNVNTDEPCSCGSNSIHDWS